MRTATAGVNQEANMSPETETGLRAQHPIFDRSTGGAMSRFALDGIAVGDGWAVILAGMATEIEHHWMTKRPVQPQDAGGLRAF